MELSLFTKNILRKILCVLDILILKMYILTFFKELLSGTI